MKTINISVRDKLPLVTSRSGRAVADNRYRLLFDFDEEWVEGLKTVVVAVSAKQYRMYPTTADYVDIELSGERYITVGVIQDTIATSQPCQILVNESIRKYMGEEIELPEPDVWTYITDQIRTLNSLRLYPVEKTAAMTQQVGVDAERRLWTYPGGSDGLGGIDRIFVMEGVSAYGPPTYTLNVLLTNGSVITCQLPNMGLELSDVITVSPSSPITSGASGFVGKLWFDTTDRVLYVCISSSNAIGAPNWLAVGGGSSSGGGTGGRGVLDVVFEAVNAEINGTSTYNMIVSLEDGTKITRRLPGFRNEDVVMFHAGAPDETLPAPRGKLLFDTDRQNMYVCADISGNGSGTRTIWKPISASGGISRETDPTVPDWAKQPEKPTYTAEEVGALPAGTRIPKKTSDLENDSGYITISVATLLNYYLKTEIYAKTEAYNREEVDSLISGLSKRLNAVADSTDVDLDQLSEIVAYIKSNKSLIDSITTTKVSVADIINNLATSDTKKPLSAAQGKMLKDMYDALPGWAKESIKPSYTKAEIGLGNVDNVRQYSAQNPPPYPVTYVNGMTGAVTLNASHVRARPETWMPSASEVGADPSGTADSKVSAHNVSETSHNDIRLLITGLTNRLNALTNSTDDDLDQLAEIVAYIKANKSLIDGITTSKVSVVDIIDNLTTNASNKPLSAKMGVQLKALIDAIKIPTTLPASDVYDWAKQPDPPKYTAADVGAATAQQVADLSKTIAEQQTAIDGKQPRGDYALSSELMSEITARENAIKQVRAEMNQVTLNYAVGSTVEECLSWLDENGDPALWYVLPDGFFYHCVEKELEGSIVPNFDNILKTGTIYLNKRYNSSNELKDADGTLAIDYVSVAQDDIVRTNKLSVWQGGYSRVRYVNASETVLYYQDAALQRHIKITTENENSYSFVVGYQNATLDDDSTNKLITNAYGIKSMRMNLNVSTAKITEDDIADLVLTINEEITYTTVSGGTERVWENTGNPVYSTKYDEPIKALENTTKEHESRLATLESGGLLMEVFAPSPQLPADGSETADFNADRNVITCNQIYDYLNPLLVKYPRYITKETMGKDESGEYDWNRYVLSRRCYDAWQKTNYPKMYAWMSGSTIIYAESCSPRIGDTMYSTPHIGTAYATVTAVDNPNQTRTVNGSVFTRDKTKDIEPTLVYTETAYSPYFVGVYEGYKNGVYNSSKSKISTIASVINGVLTDASGNTYKRYPLGDRNSKFVKMPAIVIGANEHGTGGDPAVVAIVTARMIKDLCENVNSDNPFLNLLKNDYMMVFCPVINPWGLSRQSYTNKNNVNIDRNFDTPGWGSTANSDSGYQGEYGGSENETQYFMNTLVESGTKIAIANHALGEGIDSSTGESVNAGHCHYMLGRDNSKYTADLSSIGETMATFYNLSFGNYGQAVPESYAKTRSYIDWIGAEGGAVEMQAREGFVLAGEGRLFTARIMEADYTLLLQFLHMLIKNA